MICSSSLVNIDKKAFQCNGFGDCRMIFTRSEHLARHQRKHTGEKPFNCIVPCCRRRFSRFDNMKQHTQTHHANHEQVLVVAVPDLVKSKRRRVKTTIANKRRTRKQQQQQTIIIKEQAEKEFISSMQQSLLDELFLLSDSSFLSSDEGDDDDEESIIIESPAKAANVIGHMMILPHLASYIINHPNEPVENFLFKQHRISIKHLFEPVHLLLTNQISLEDKAIYITLDELEAIQGLSNLSLLAYL